MTPAPSDTPFATADAEDESDEDSLRQARRGTVRVRNIACVGLGSGTGFILGDGVLVTNRHVVEGARRLEVNTWDGHTVEVQVASAAFARDLAVIQVEGAALDHLTHLTLAAEDPGEGSHVTVVGHPRGGRLAVTTGHIVDYVDGEDFEEDGQVMRFTAEVRPGNSGGAVINESGEVVAVVFAIEVATGYGLGVPASELLTFEGRDRGNPIAC